MSVTVKRFKIKLSYNGEIVSITDLIDCLDTCSVRCSYALVDKLIDTVLEYKVSKILKQLPEEWQSRIYTDTFDRLPEDLRSHIYRKICVRDYSKGYDPRRRISYYIAKSIADNYAQIELSDQT